MNNIFGFIEKETKINSPEIINLRRELHKIPELGFEEYKTSLLIANYLENLGLNVVKGVGKTGVVADINEEIQDYCIALRFDIDALPIFEETDLPFASIHYGKMHACGHDGHIAIGLGIAKLINNIRAKIPARIRLIFQPAEEGRGGAKRMIDDGVLNEPTPDVIIGIHIWPYLDTGEIGIKKGPIMAAGDKFSIKLFGKEGHGSGPHLAIDPTIMVAEVINGFQNIVGRNINPLEPTVISVGTINGGNSFNTIPSQIELTGTTRFTNIQLRKTLKKDMEKLIEGITLAYNGSYEFNYEKCFDVTNSNVTLVNILRNTINENVKDIKVIELDTPSMASEDFSEYENYSPGIYFFIGTKNHNKNCIYPLHNSKYNFDESILTRSVEVLTKFVFNLANKKQKGGE